MSLDLPDTTMLNFFNKVIISLADLTPSGDYCTTDSLINHCKSIVFGGTIGEYDLILEHCKFCGLISTKNGNITLSSLGQKFLSANRERYFELNEAQKQILVERIVFKGPWNIHARGLFELFSVNQTEATYELSITDNSLNKTLNKTIHFFKYLGILYEKDYLIFVENKYSELVYHLTADSKAISEQQLEKLLMENNKLGAKAEFAVVEFERKRLLKLGKIIQAGLVRRISPINQAAGYDVESFDGNNDDVFPNRFIEVKATTSDDIRFYWTGNEIEVAKKKNTQYWIYMMKNFKENRPQECLPIMIQNPEYVIPRHLFLTMEVSKYLISEIAEVELSEQNIDDLIWYNLV